MSGALAVLPPAIDRADGIVLAADGQIDAARERLQSALSAYDRMGVLFESARTREHLAEIVEPVAATALRIDAARTYGRLGARPHLARVTAVHQT